MKRLVLVLLVAVLLMAPTDAPAATRACGSVTVALGDGFEGSAARIVATRVSCRRARRVARACVRDRLRGWSVRQAPRGRPQPRFVLRRGAARIWLSIAGGGGCFEY